MPKMPHTFGGCFYLVLPAQYCLLIRMLWTRLVLPSFWSLTIALSLDTWSLWFIRLWEGQAWWVGPLTMQPLHLLIQRCLITSTPVLRVSCSYQWLNQQCFFSTTCLVSTMVSCCHGFSVLLPRTVFFQLVSVIWSLLWWMCSLIFDCYTLLQLSILKAIFEVLLSGLYLLLYCSVFNQDLLSYFGNVFNCVPLLWKLVDELVCGSQYYGKVGPMWYVDGFKTITCNGMGVCGFGLTDVVLRCCGSKYLPLRHVW